MQPFQRVYINYHNPKNVKIKKPFYWLNNWNVIEVERIIYFFCSRAEHAINPKFKIYCIIFKYKSNCLCLNSWFTEVSVEKAFSDLHGAYLWKEKQV